MSISTNDLSESKKAFYRLPRVSQKYDELRFGGDSGQRINRRELELVKALLPPRGSVLDLACGTGRLSAFLESFGYRPVALDSSPTMADLAKGKGLSRVVVGDAFSLPLSPASFDAVVALRLLFHFPYPHLLLEEMERVCRPGGCLVFDTYRWSIRSLIGLFPGTWGGRVHSHSPGAIRKAVHKLGMQVLQEVDCFLFSPYLYRLLPLPAVRVLETLERVAPRTALSRVFWQVAC